MSIESKKKQILRKAVDVVKRIGRNERDLPGYIKERAAQFVAERRANCGANVLAEKLMGPAKGSNIDRFPSYTVIGERKHAARTKEIANMIKKGNIKQAKDFISSKREEFDRLNPVE
jgi:hypothetical protein